MAWGVLEAYRDHLPVGEDTPMITLGEGNTPLVRSYRLSEEIGCPELYFKLEGCNPTGSFKDRGMVVAVAKAMEEGSEGIICASTGNTSASAAAYGARVGVPATVLVPQGDVAFRQAGPGPGPRRPHPDHRRQFRQGPLPCSHHYRTSSSDPGQLRQPSATGGTEDRCLRNRRQVWATPPTCLCIPVGNAGNITSYWKGFKEYLACGKARSLPKMMGFQAQGAAPLVDGRPVDSPHTVASAIRIGSPASWLPAIAARDESGGVIDAVTDREILDAYRILSTREGIFCEPASAASVAGLIKLHRQGMDLSDRTVVCIITGSGLKDPELAVRFISTGVKEVSSDLEEVEAALLELSA